MSAKVHFLPRSEPVAHADTLPLITVPATAVALRDGRSVVYTVTAGRAVEIPLVTRRHLGSGIAVLQGLAVGTPAIDSVGHRVRRGGQRQMPLTGNRPATNPI